MPKYKVCFIVTERVEYSIMIKADTPKEAFNKFNDPDYDRGDYYEECFLGIIENESDIQIEGEWEDFITDEKHTSSSLKRYDKPIKMK
jgi:hypothetical protein